MRGWKYLSLGCVLIATAAAIASSGILRPKTRPNYAPGIADRDYQFRLPSARAEAFSSIAIPVKAERVNDKKTRAHMFQLRDAKLKVDHCSISRFALIIHDDGYFALSLRGEQNADLGPSPKPPFVASTPTAKFTEHLLRNEFFVIVRGLGPFPETEVEKDITTGKPVHFRLTPAPFWVQRVQPYDYYQTGKSTEIERHFDLVDRLAVEFYYK